jgi:hypothetical protein
MRLALVIAALVMGVGGFFAVDAQAGPGDKDQGRQGTRMDPRQPAAVARPAAPAARQPMPQVRQPAPQVRQPAAQPRQPAPVARPAAPEVRRPAPAVRQPAPTVRRVAQAVWGWSQSAELARRQAEERRREIEQARALTAQADELIRQAGELGAARDRILAKVAEMRREARRGDRGRHLGWEKGNQPAGRHPEMQAVSKLLEQAAELAAAKDRLLASAAALQTQAQNLMTRGSR